MEDKRVKVAVIGAGAWGKNLVRNFAELGALECVVDTSEETLGRIRQAFGVRTTNSIETVLADPAIDAVVIAAPAAQHYEIARECLTRGKDVYIEKPLALHVEEGEELVALAEKNKKILMVGHILEYHPAILELKRLITNGDLGKIRYIYSSRVNLGKLRTEENILWSFAPHDISAILFLLGEVPSRVSSQGGRYLDSKIFDTTLSTCEFKSGVQAHIFVSWLHPFKEQKLSVVGDKSMVVFDDVEPERKLVMYSHHIDWHDRVPVALKEEGVPLEIPKGEPLRLECEHFLNCVSTRVAPRTDGPSALRVLRVLQASERSLLSDGQMCDVITKAPDYKVHPTAVIDFPCEIGAGTTIWHFSHIMSGASIGKHCNFGQNVVISPGVKIGSNVKIQNNVSVYTGVELEDDVFCGPSMVFTNVTNPRSHINRRNEYKRTLVKKGASIGANSTVVCGVTIGSYSFVAAGAVVTHDIPDFALVMGVPAMQAGWICYCGIRLEDSGATTICGTCGRKYKILNGTCELLAPESTQVIATMAA